MSVGSLALRTTHQLHVGSARVDFDEDANSDNDVSGNWGRSNTDNDGSNEPDDDDDKAERGGAHS